MRRPFYDFLPRIRVCYVFCATLFCNASRVIRSRDSPDSLSLSLSPSHSARGSTPSSFITPVHTPLRSPRTLPKNHVPYSPAHGERNNEQTSGHARNPVVKSAVTCPLVSTLPAPVKPAPRKCASLRPINTPSPPLF